MQSDLVDVSCEGDEQPNRILKELGLIRQTVSRRCRSDLYFKPNVGWVDNTDRPHPDFCPTKFSSNKRNEEFDAKAVFLLMGSYDPSPTSSESSATTTSSATYDLSAFERYLSHRSDEAEDGDKQTFHRLSQQLEKVASEQLKTTAGDVEVDPMFLTDQEVFQFIIQYVTRSLPSATRRTDAVLFTSVDGELQRLLNEGIVAHSDAVPLDAVLVCDGTSDVPEGFSHVCRLPAATRFAVNRMTFGLASAASLGYQSDGRSNSQKQREKIPLTVILFGGHTSVKFDLLSAALAEYPIYVVEGSGGYADELVALSYRVSDIGGAASVKGRTFLGNLDSETATILQSRVLVVNKGTVADQFTRSLEFSVEGDTTLLAAWSRYQTWMLAARRYRRIFQGQMITILFLGIVSTGLSVFQTFIQLMWPELVQSGSNHWLRQFYWYLNIVIIVLPISMQLAQTMTNKMNAGGKWASLRNAADSCLREIYLMRAEMNDYSAASIELSAKNADSTGVKAATSRQDLLHSRIEEYTAELSTSIMEGVVVKPYDGPLPPPNALASGDDGISDLSADEYLRYRLEPICTYYQKQVAGLNRERTALEASVHGFNTLGTLLAALATAAVFGPYNLQAWVAFTTSIVSGLGRFEHWMMLEWRQRKMHDSAMRLSSVRAWWFSRGARANRGAVRDQLGTKTEGIITEELNEFTKQLHSTMEALKAEAAATEEESDNAVREVKEGVRNVVFKCQQLQVSALTAENIQAALKNPSSSKGRLVRTALADLQNELVDMVPTSVNEVALHAGQVGDFSTIVKSVVGPHGCLQSSTEPLAALLPTSVTELALDERRRNRFLRMLCSGTEIPNMNGGLLIDSAKQLDPKLQQQLELMPIRLLLESVKQVTQQETLDTFLTSLDTIGIVPFDVVLPKQSLAFTVENLLPLTRMPWKAMQHRSLLQLIESKDLPEKLSDLPEAKLRALLKRVEFFFTPTTPLGQLARQTTVDAAQLDLHNIINPTPADRIVHAAIGETVAGLHFDLSLMSRDSLLRFFPSTFHSSLASMDTDMIRECLKQLSEGTPLNRCTTAAFHRISNGNVKSQLGSVLQHPEQKEAFAVSITNITQEEVFRQNKEFFLRRIRGHGLASKAFIDDLRALPEEYLKELISRTRAECGNSYVGQLFDQLSVETSTIDVSMMLSYEDQVQLVSRLKEFRGGEFRSLSKKQILSRIGIKPLCSKLVDLSEDQLEEIIERLLVLMSGSLYTQVLRRCLAHPKLQVLMPLFSSLSQLQIDRLVVQLLSMKVREGKDSSFLKYVADVDVRRMMCDLHIESQQVGLLIQGLQKMLPDTGAADLFISVATEVDDVSLFESVDTVFGHHVIRRDVMLFIQRLVEDGFYWKHVESMISRQRGGGSLVDIVLPNLSTRSQFSGGVALCRHLDTSLQGNAPRVFISLIGTLLSSSSLNIFNSVAVNIRTYNLRRVFRRVESRILLIPLIIQLSVIGNHSASREEFLLACEGYTEFSTAVPDVRLLPQNHLMALIRSVQSYVREKPLGQLYLTLLQRRDDSPERYGSLQVFLDAATITAFLAQHIRRNAFAVEKAMDDFDSTRFLQRKQSSRYQVIRAFVPNESVSLRFTQWGREPLHALFVAMRTKLVYQRVTSKHAVANELAELHSQKEMRNHRNKFVARVGAISRFVRLTKSMTDDVENGDGDSDWEGDPEQEDTEG